MIRISAFYEILKQWESAFDGTTLYVTTILEEAVSATVYCIKFSTLGATVHHGQPKEERYEDANPGFPSKFMVVKISYLPRKLSSIGNWFIITLNVLR